MFYDLIRKLGLAALVLFFPSLVSAGQSMRREDRVFLRSGWVLQSSCKVSSTGAQVSSPGFETKGWHAATVPSTVVAALVADKTFPDPYFGENLRSIPGTTYPIGTNFSKLSMPEDSPFHCSWWYRIEFSLPQAYSGRHVWLNFGGINNRANVWLNGREIAGVAGVVGAYRTYEFDATPYLRPRSTQVLAVEVFAQRPDDLGINWVDWNPAPPDKDMGLWRPVYLRSSGAVELRNPFVITRIVGNSLDRADLTVEAQVRNASQDAVAGVLRGNIGDIRFEQPVKLAAGESRTIRFAPEQFPQLRLKNPKLWWPRQMGSPNLYSLSLRFSIAKEVSDKDTIQFGVREITSQLDEQGHRLFFVNGKKVLIRGGGWAPDMLLRESPGRLVAQFDYVQSLNLNTIRLEGKMESDQFYELADQRGILIMAGWCCCDYWEEWPAWKEGDWEVATASLRSQIMRMRSHPSMLVWLNGSDNPPPPDVEQAYLKVLNDADWPNPVLSSASGKPAGTGASGVKMLGPYDYVPPAYWYADKFGGAFGFNTETSPGPSLPPAVSLRKMLPAGDIHPGSPAWNYHAGGGGFKDLSHLEEAMRAIYGPPSDLPDYERKAQAMAYDSERAMFEAYSGNKYGSTGVIQWMLNNAWPSLIWHLYDYYLQPAGAYFGVKEACEPLHIQYSYGDRSIRVVNSEYKDRSGLTVNASLYDFELHKRFSREAKTDVVADGVAKVLTIPETAFESSSPIYFLELTLASRAGSIVSRNFYWLSPKPDTYDWANTTYRFTPVSSYEDLTALQKLPKASLSVSATAESTAEGPAVRVHLRNTSKHLAFQVHLAVRPGGGRSETLPVFWSDNYVELVPGEAREIIARYSSEQILHDKPELIVSGWNIEPQQISVANVTPTATRKNHN